MERLLKRKKELVLREEEEEIHQPKVELSALDRFNQRNRLLMDFPEPVRVPRYASKDWEEPGTVEEHKKIILAWVVGCLLFASLLSFIAVTWSCCRKKENMPSSLEIARGTLALICRKRKRKEPVSVEQDAHEPMELEPLK